MTFSDTNKTGSVERAAPTGDGHRANERKRSPCF